MIYPSHPGGWKINHHRYTEYTSCQPEGQADSIWHDVSNRHSTGLPFWWTGSTYFIDDSVREPAKAVAAVKNSRNKSKAKKAARAQGFTFMDELIPEKGKAMIMIDSKTSEVDMDLTWDWTYPEVRKTKPWKGKTIFRFSGDQDVDYGIESREIRGSMTDLEYVGSERTGDEGIYLVGTGSYEVVFLEDNQATIRIIESGKSPSFRHTDKTQRLNLSWLAEQFRRKHFRLVYVTSQLQAADILTKPFANSEKWKRAVSLIAVCRTPLYARQPKGKPALGNFGPICLSLMIVYWLSFAVGRNQSLET